MNGQQEIEAKLNEQLRFFFSRRLAEKATPEYFDEMLAQVHRRLRQERVERPRWRDRLAEFFSPSFLEARLLLVRFALPAMLFVGAAGFALQHDRATPRAAEQVVARSRTVGACSPVSLVSAKPDLVGDLKADRTPSVVAPTRVLGFGEEMATKAKEPENGGRSFVSVLPVRYEASVDF